jgi:hypothetical protein
MSSAGVVLTLLSRASGGLRVVRAGENSESSIMPPSSTVNQLLPARVPSPPVDHSSFLAASPLLLSADARSRTRSPHFLHAVNARASVLDIYSLTGLFINRVVAVGHVVARFIVNVRWCGGGDEFASGATGADGTIGRFASCSFKTRRLTRPDIHDVSPPAHPLPLRRL